MSTKSEKTLPAVAGNIPAISAEGGLSRYLSEIRRFPILTAEEERRLADDYYKTGNVKAAHKLVTSHLRLVAKIAFGFKGYGLPVADLISEGNIGLMRAVKKFEPQKGFRVATYAMWWIRASITEYILKSWSLVKAGSLSSQKKLFFSLKKTKKRLGIEDQGELDPDQAKSLSSALKVSENDVVGFNRRLSATDVSLNAPLPNDDGATFMETLEDDAPTPEDIYTERETGKVRSKLLHDAMDVLGERERDIIMTRRLSEDPPTLEELGQKYGVSRERIRQLEARALKKLQTAVRETAPDKLENLAPGDFL